MRIRSSYFKVTDMDREIVFWQALLESEPVKKGRHWSEFIVGEVRIGLLLNDFGEELEGCACVPVIEFGSEQLDAAIERAKRAGASIVIDGLADPKMNSILLASPSGHEFELCNYLAL